MDTRYLDLSVVCLICLQEKSGCRLISEEDLMTPGVKILEKIIDCTNLAINKQNLPHLPNKLCRNCLNDVHIAWCVHRKCDKANKIFGALYTPNWYSSIETVKHELEQHKLRIPKGLQIQRIDSLASTPAAQPPPTPSSVSIIPAPSTTTEPVSVEFSLGEEKSPYLLSNEALNLDPYTSLIQNYGENETNECVLKDKSLCTGSENSNFDEFISTDTEEGLDIDDLFEDINNSSNDAIAQPNAKNYVNSIASSNCTKNSEQSGDETQGMLSPSSKHSKKKTKMAQGGIKKDITKRNTKPLKICTICGNNFKYQHALAAHMRRHSNERPFPCEMCDKAFISTVELRRHMRVHTRQKPYGCKYCERRFSDFGSSKKHERIHTGERPYVCEICNKQFAYSHVLSVHRRIHTGQKQFKCAYCDKGFTKKIYLITHTEQHEFLGDVPLATKLLQYDIEINDEDEDDDDGDVIKCNMNTQNQSTKICDMYMNESTNTILGSLGACFEHSKVSEESIATSEFIGADEDECDVFGTDDMDLAGHRNSTPHCLQTEYGDEFSTNCFFDAGNIDNVKYIMS